MSRRLPHFFIVGVQKSGTSALCSMLEQHPGIAMSRPKEPMLLSRDDIAVHTHFFLAHPQKWDELSWQHAREEWLAEYDEIFAHAEEGQIRGEGSTSYFLARSVPARIAMVQPQARVIIMLREPVSRAYSAYWHYVKEGISTRSFGDHLAYESGYTIEMGCYVPWVKRWKDVFGDRCKVLLYEQFIEHPLDTTNEVVKFLGLTDTLPREAKAYMDKNTALVPRSLLLQCLVNRLCQRISNAQTAILTEEAQHAIGHVMERMRGMLLYEGQYPPMQERLRAQLKRYYARENAALETLTGLPISEKWK